MPSGSLNLRSKFFFFHVVAEIEEEGAAGVLDLLLCLPHVLDLNAEMVDADELVGSSRPWPRLPRYFSNARLMVHTFQTAAPAYLAHFAS